MRRARRRRASSPSAASYLVNASAFRRPLADARDAAGFALCALTWRTFVLCALAFAFFAFCVAAFVAVLPATTMVADAVFRAVGTGVAGCDGAAGAAACCDGVPLWPPAGAPGASEPDDSPQCEGPPGAAPLL